MWRIQNYLRIIISTVAISLTGVLGAQTLEDAQSLYNEGGAAMQEGNTELAAEKFAACISICETLYEEEEDVDAEELMNTIKPTLPKLYLQVSQTKAKEKDLESGLAYSAKAKKAAQQLGDNETKAKAEDLASKIYYSYGLSKYKANNYDGAIVDLSSAIDEDNQNFKAHYLLIVIHKTNEDEPALIAATRKLMAMDAKDDNKDKAIAMTANYFYNKGVKAKQASKYDEALESINSSLEFSNDNADAYYLLTSIYNSKEDWNNAITSAKEGIQHEAAGNQARFYFELGSAYFGNGDRDAACEAYSKAAMGDYLELSNYQMEHVVNCN